MKKGFTLIEMLIVVLIIAILAAIALPQYRAATERSIMSEGVSILKNISEAHLRYYLATGGYLSHKDIDKMDINIPGEDYPYASGVRKKTKYFIYSPNGYSGGLLALANRIPLAEAYDLRIYYENPSKVVCMSYSAISKAQYKLCAQINAKGSL